MTGRSFFLGCAVWAYKDWVGSFYPPGSRSGDFLKLYGQRFTTVEGNTTFYNVPDRSTLLRWAAETPTGFEFCLKLPKALTHNGLLKPAIPGTLSFVAGMQALGDRLGPLFAQLPPHYSPDNWDDLKDFLTAFPRQQVPLALEVRHIDWFKAPYCDRLNDLLTELGVGRVLLDSRPIYQDPKDLRVVAERKKPNVPLQPIVTAPFSLIRFISHPDPALNQCFMEDWVPHLQAWLTQGTHVYFFVHCPQEEKSPANAYAVQTLLEQRQVPVPPLPVEIVSTNTQLSLF